MKKLLFTSFCIFFAILLYAQDTAVVRTEDASGMRANEKIYVVVAVLATILAGLFIYLIRLDRKISKMEKGSE